MNQIIIGLEAHDGSGKSTTAKEIQTLFNGEVFFTKDEMKNKRDVIYDSKASQKDKMDQIEKTYVQESLDCLEQTKNASFVILDRTWLSNSVEENVRDMLDKDVDPYFADRTIPEGVVKPDLIFQILIPEEERRRRVADRIAEKKEKMKKRDHRLNDDADYRSELEKERVAYGCIPLRLRLRDPKVCALRAAQVLLGNEKIPPLKIKLSD